MSDEKPHPPRGQRVEIHIASDIHMHTPPRVVACPRCRGTGRIDGRPSRAGCLGFLCPTCRATGQLVVPG